jgi:hypothetical protein
MNKVLVAMLAGLFAAGAFAADDAAKSRADVKKEAAAANMKGETGKGEGNAMATTAAAKLSKEEMAAVRASVKAEAKKGAVAHGEANELTAKAEAKLSKEEMVAVRAMVKAEAADAVKKGTVKSGEK